MLRVVIPIIENLGDEHSYYLQAKKRKIKSFHSLPASNVDYIDHSNNLHSSHYLISLLYVPNVPNLER